jgi:hypothetical protein
MSVTDRIKFFLFWMRFRSQHYMHYFFLTHCTLSPSPTLIDLSVTDEEIMNQIVIVRIVPIRYFESF